MSYGSKKSEGGPQKAEVPLSDDAQQASPLFFKLPFLPQNGADGETRTLVGQCPAVYETAAVATEPHRRNGGSPRICTVFHPGKSRSFTIKVCDPRRDAKAELNRRSQACEVLADTGISRRVKWTERRVSLPLDLAPEASASLLGYTLEMDGHVGSAPTIPVWKTGVYLSTPMPEEMESRAGVTPT